MVDQSASPVPTFEEQVLQLEQQKEEEKKRKREKPETRKEKRKRRRVMLVSEEEQVEEQNEEQVEEQNKEQVEEQNEEQVEEQNNEGNNCLVEDCLQLGVEEEELQELSLENELGFDPLELENDLKELEELEKLDFERLSTPDSPQDPSSPQRSPEKHVKRGLAANSSSVMPTLGSCAIKSAYVNGRGKSANTSS